MVPKTGVLCIGFSYYKYDTHSSSVGRFWPLLYLIKYMILNVGGVTCLIVGEAKSGNVFSFRVITID